jgi:multisubunit Na+/H+ antiporter MnhB subunit
MKNAQLFVLIGAVTFVYLAFALAILFVKRKLTKERAIKWIIIVPILLSFAFGIALMMYALSF